LLPQKNISGPQYGILILMFLCYFEYATNSRTDNSWGLFGTLSAEELGM